MRQPDNGPDDWAARAFRAALAGHSPTHLFGTSKTTPLLRCPTDTPAVALLDALFTRRNTAHSTATAAPSAAPMVASYRLWMPGGQSAVEFQFCPRCHHLLNDIYRDAEAGWAGPPALVWR